MAENGGEGRGEPEEEPRGLDPEAEDATPGRLISGLRGAGFNGSAAQFGTAQSTGTAGHAALSQRLANTFGRLGVADEVWLNVGLNRIFRTGPGGVQRMGISNRQPDLVVRIGNRVMSIEIASHTQLHGRGARQLRIAMRDTAAAAERVGAPHTSVLLNAPSLPANAANRVLSATARVVRALNYLSTPLLGLEIAGHAYEIYASDNRVVAAARAVSTMGSSRMGARAGAQLGARVGFSFGPTGAAVGALVGALGGGVAGSLAPSLARYAHRCGYNYFAARQLQGDETGLDGLMAATVVAATIAGGDGGDGGNGGRGGGAATQPLGGVDLGGSLHFIDHLPTTTGILVDPTIGKAMGASKGGHSSSPGCFADLTPHDLAVIQKIEFFNGGKAEFSLDPADPLDPFGPHQKKVFRPRFLAGTDMGELLFRADVLLKRLCLGLEAPPLPGWRGPFDFGATGGESIHRSWIVPAKMTVQLVGHPQYPGAKCIRPGPVKLAVLACEQVADTTAADGLRDVVASNQQDPAFLMAAQCTQRMDELISYYPTFQRLYQAYQAVALFRALRQSGVTIDYAWVEMNAFPLFTTPGKFRTLRNSRSTQSTSHQVNAGGTVQTTTTHTRSLVGGCILATQDAVLEVQETTEGSAELAQQLQSMRDCAATGADLVPQCYRLGRRLDEEGDPAAALRRELESGAQSLELPIPCPPLEPGPTVVPLPFAAQVSFQCAVCQRPLAADEGAEDGGADPVRFQSIRGLPLCSRIHPGAEVVGPTFRLTRYRPCATCGEEIRQGSIITTRSTEEPALDFHECCAPPEAVQRAREAEESEGGELEQLLLRLQASQEGGQTPVGSTPGASGSRLLDLTSGMEMQDMQRALEQSLREVAPPAAGDLGADDLMLQAAMSASLQSPDGGPQSGEQALSTDQGLEAAVAASLVDAGRQEEDPDLSAALTASLVDTEQAENSELQRALTASLHSRVEEEAHSDPELEAAIAASLAQEPAHPGEAATEDGDPDLLAALAMSLEVSPQTRRERAAAAAEARSQGARR